MFSFIKNISNKLDLILSKNEELYSKTMQSLYNYENQLRTVSDDIIKTNYEILERLCLIEDQLKSNLNNTEQLNIIINQIKIIKKSVQNIPSQFEKDASFIVNGIDKSHDILMREISQNLIPLALSANYKVRSIDLIKDLLSNYSFDTVLDVGCGEGLHTDFFLKAGKHVTSLDYGNSVYFERKSDKQNVIIADFNKYEFSEQYDCVWCSHILEHQLNVNLFLKKVFEVTKDNGIVAISVPPAKHAIVGGHLTIWNPGLLLYNLVLAGFDCSDAKVIDKDYDISIIVHKKPVPIDVFESLSFDSGDIIKIKQYLPSYIDYSFNKSGDSFDGKNI